MVRVLHLLSTSPEFQNSREAAALARAAGDRWTIQTRTVGERGDYRNTALAFLHLRQRVARDFDIVHVWNVLEFAIAAAAGASHIVFSPSTVRPLGPRAVRFLRRFQRVSWIFQSAGQHRNYVDAGLPADRCRVILPGIETPASRHGRDVALRSTLGFNEQDIVIVAPGESIPSAAHREALWAVSILHVLNPKWKLLLWGRGPKVGNCSRLADNFLQETVLTLAEKKLGRRVEFEEILPAADAVMCAATSRMPIAPLAICMASGLPIVAARCAATDEFLTDGENAALVAAESPRLLAQRAMEVMSDGELAGRIGAGARAAAQAQFSRSRFIEQYSEVYAPR